MRLPVPCSALLPTVLSRSGAISTVPWLLCATTTRPASPFPVSLTTTRSRSLLCRGLLLGALALVCCPVLADADPNAAPATQPLQLLQALAITDTAGQPIADLQPSGLAFCQGRLLMVSDRHNQVFQLQLKDDAAVAEPVLAIADLPQPQLDDYAFGVRWWNKINHRYDWEGIACDDQNLYLLSETLAQVLVYAPEGGWRWLGPEVYRQGRGKGLFEQLNAFAEGLAVSDTHMLVAAERHPRGLVLLSRQQSPTDSRSGGLSWSVQRVQRLQPFPSLLEPVDFAGVLLEANRVYTLERNQHQLCRRDLALQPSQRCWSYQHVEDSAEYGYRSGRFGIAEGIARQAERLFLVLDNNGDRRRREAHDRRPQLWVFATPADWTP